MVWFFRRKEVQEEAKSVLKYACMEENALFHELHTAPSGITDAEAAVRRKRFGDNLLKVERREGIFVKFFKNFIDPVTLLLIALGIIQYFSDDMKACIMIGLMVAMSVILRFIQEYGADKAIEKLQAMVKTTALVVRDGKERDIPHEGLVPGDIIMLSAGDLVPADVRIIDSKGLHVNQSTLTGESFAVVKSQERAQGDSDALNLANICFLGTTVESGSAKAIVLATGKNTYLGAMAQSINVAPPTSFHLGMRSFTFMLMRFIFIMVPLVFIINGISKGNWFEAFLFALAVAVGMTPDMLPMIVTVNLTKGARSMSKKKVIVKRLEAIQNFGAMDVLCTDKTGTLTQGKVILERHLNVEGVESERALQYAYLNSVHQTGLRNAMDVAILQHAEKFHPSSQEYEKVDELPFDFFRKRMSVVLRHKHGSQLLICKGAVDETLALSRYYEHNGKTSKLTEKERTRIRGLMVRLNEEGFRVVLLAYREFPNKPRAFTVDDESGLTVLGVLGFLDPPKEGAAEAVAELQQYGIGVKILTGDSEYVTKKICRDVRLTSGVPLLGPQIEKMSEQELMVVVETTTIFARLSPMHKERIIKALRANGHVVGFMGDGINDAPALKAADIGISVDTAVDIARESSDIILLEKSLSVLKDGAIEGRKVFGNIIKYLKMATSSNFGNMFSVIGASIFLPFLPMQPLQIITNNILYDTSQLPLPTDNVDEEYIKKPRKWQIDKIQRFVLFIGPVSSLFDYLTFFMMLVVFNAWANPALFQTGWFVESLLSQTLIIHIIRTNRIPFFQSRASIWLTMMTVAIAALGIWLPYSPFAETLGFVPLPLLYWVLLLCMIIVYGVLTHLVKMWFVRKYGI